MNILLSSYDFHEPWAHQIMTPLLKPNMKVTVIPFSFEDYNVHNIEEYDSHYGINGRHVPWILRPFHHYGIYDITFIDYYRDSKTKALQKVLDADIIFLTGGLPDQYLKRIQEFDLEEPLKQSKALFIGGSAGAMIQLDKYHISPDDDYPEYCYEVGLGLVKDLEIEVHYCGSDKQNYGLNRVIQERHLPTYTIPNDGGLFIDNNTIIPFGTAKKVK